jgi:hypothetical protein
MLGIDDAMFYHMTLGHISCFLCFSRLLQLKLGDQEIVLWRKRK